MSEIERTNDPRFTAMCGGDGPPVWRRIDWRDTRVRAGGGSGDRRSAGHSADGVGR